MLAKKKSRSSRLEDLYNPVSDDFEEFICLLSHDFRNSTRALLEVPLWIAEDLEASGLSLDASINENLDLMRIHTRRLDQMLSDLLVYSRVGRKQTLRTVTFQDVFEVVSENLNAPKSMNLRADFQLANLSMGDRDLQTLLFALLSNSIKHRDSLTTFASVVTFLENGEIILRIEDDGPGIQEKYLDRVLEAMITLKPRDDVEGSGMGLTIVKKIVSLYGGDMKLSERFGERGLLVEISFPVPN